MLERIGLALLPSFLRPLIAKQEAKPDKLYPTSCLDGLRGIAALFVFFFHILFAYRSQPYLEYGYGVEPGFHYIWQLPFVRLFTAGHAMVSIFFVVGGYVSSLKPLKLMHSHSWEALQQNLASSFFRRGIRLYLPPVVATFITMLAIHLGLWEFSSYYARQHDYVFYHDYHQEPKPTFGEQLNHWWHQTWDMTNIFGIFPPDHHGYQIPIYNQYDPHLWTVAYEMRGSLIVAVVLLLFSRCHVPLRLLFVFCTTLFCGYRDRWEVVLFLSGTFLAEVDLLLQARRSSDRSGNGSEPLLATHQDPAISPHWTSAPSRSWSRIHRILSHLWFGQKSWIVLFIVGCYFASAPNLNIGHTPGYLWLDSIPFANYYYDRKRFLQGSGCTLIVWAVSNSPILQKPFTSKFALYMGKISYSFYIVHGPMNHMVGYYVTGRIWDVMGKESTAQFCTGLFLGSMVLAICVFWTADLFWRVVDCNAVKASKMVEELCFVKDGEKA